MSRLFLILLLCVLTSAYHSNSRYIDAQLSPIKVGFEPQVSEFLLKRIVVNAQEEFNISVSCCTSCGARCNLYFDPYHFEHVIKHQPAVFVTSQLIGKVHQELHYFSPLQKSGHYEVMMVMRRPWEPFIQSIVVWDVQVL